MSTPIAPHFLASESGLNTSPASALFHVIPVPLERSVSYGKGTQGGPAAILEASQQLESWDGRSLPVELGIHTTDVIDCSGEIEQVLQRIRKQTAVALETGKIPVLLGGEHMRLCPGARAAKRLELGQQRGVDDHRQGRFQLSAALGAHVSAALIAMYSCGTSILSGIRRGRM